MTTLAVVPARAGSKSIPHKNLALVCGKPLLWYTFDCALRSRLLSRVILSTDDQDAADLAESMEVSVEWRPGELCRDNSTTLDVLRWHQSQQDEHFDAICCLQPTTPLRRPEDIDGSIELMERTGCDSVISYVDVGPNHPARMVSIAEDGRTYPLEGERFAQRQDLPRRFLRSGDVYLTRWNVLASGSLVGGDSRAWVIPPDRHCNVDGPLDLAWARKRVSMLTGAST